MDLRKLYHVVVLAYGAESDRELGIPGENLAGIHSAREFVWWYNGHPDCRYFPVDLQSTDTTVVLGQVESISEDMRTGLLDTCHSSHPGRLGLLEALQTKDVQFVSFKDWLKIDAKEKELGSVRGKPREKITSWQELLKVANE